MILAPNVCDGPCPCEIDQEKTKLIVITGGPGAGKTAVLEVLKKILCQHTVILPESASIVFGGGFWRLQTPFGKKAAQRAIFHVQRETESIALEGNSWSVGLCDRGSLDGLAYWTGTTQEFFDSFNTTLEEEYQRYHAVIHLRCPTLEMGYNHQNPLRLETASEADKIDKSIFKVWNGHPNYHSIASFSDFTKKVDLAKTLVKNFLPSCCLKAIDDNQ